MMELVAPLLVAFLFVVFGFSYRGRPGCDACGGKGICRRQQGCIRKEEEREQ